MNSPSVECSICSAAILGIPYGPSDALCCQDCWFRAGSYRAVQMHAHGPQVGDEVEFVDSTAGLMHGDVVQVDTDERTAFIRYHSGDDWMLWTELR